MGYIKNHAIVVTTYDEKIIIKAHKKAVELLGEIVSDIRPTAINENWSFAILPDGSKEGWDTSIEHDEKRSEFVEYLQSFDYEDESNPFDWVEVSFDEQGIKKVER